MRKLWKFGLICLVVFALGIAGSPLLFKARPADRLPTVILEGGPMVQYGDTGGETAMVIAWRTSKPCRSKVVWRSADKPPEPTFTVEDWTPKTRHALTIEGLECGKFYYYTVYSGYEYLGDGSFWTACQDYRKFSFAVFGDSGSGTEDQHRVARQIAANSPELILHTGDLIYSDGADEDYPEKFYKPYRDLIDHIPFFPSLGNHDCRTANGKPWLENFHLPGNERYYSFDYGDAHFVALDSVKITDEQTRWLEEDLAKTKKLWKFVYFHHPPFTVVEKRVGTENPNHPWVKLFEQYQVDIVFCGHDHLYARFKPIDGVVYIVEGVGGKSLYEKVDDPRVAFSENHRYGFGWVDISDKTLRFRHYYSELEWSDELVIKK